MVRTQIQLTDAQAQSLKELALTRGTSMAELVREAVDQLLARAAPNPDELRRRAREAAGRFRSGRGDLAAEHDKYLEAAYLE